MDFGAPVAQGVDVSPNRNVQTISGLLGIKQQQLALQTGQFQKETAEAEATKAGLGAQGQTEATDFLKNFDFAKKMGADGTLDLNQAYTDPKFEKLGPGKTMAAEGLLKIKGQQIQNKQEMAKLNDTVIVGAGRMVGALAKDQDIIDGNEDGIKKFDSTADLIREMYPDQGGAFIDKLAQVIHSDHIKPKDRAAAIQAFQNQALDVVQQKQLQNPQATTNAAGQILNRDPQTGAISAPSQAPGQGNLNPASPQVAGAAGAATGTSAVDTARYGALTNAAAASQSGIALADQVAALAKQVRTGQLTKEWADRLTVLQQDNPKITARQMLGKYAAQLQTLAEGNAASDVERNQIHSGMPDPDHMDAPAVEKAAQYLHGYFRLAQERGRNALEHVSQHGVQGLTMSDTGFSQSRDPFVYSFKDMNTADKKAYLLERFGPGESAALRAFQKRVNSK